MNAYVALLYSIVLPDGKRVTNAPLCAMFEALDYRAPEALLATGNVIFGSDETDVAMIEQRLEHLFSSQFGRHVDIIVKNDMDWRDLVAGYPFADVPDADPSQIGVKIMRHPATDVVQSVLEPKVVGAERLAFVGGHIWGYFPHGVAKSKLASAISSKRSGVGTSRNWNTVRKIEQALRKRA